MRISIKHDMDSLVAQLSDIEKKIIPAATVSALNKTATKAFTEVKRDVSKSMGLKQKYVASNLKKIRAERRLMQSGVIVSKKPLAVIKTGNATQTKKGVKVGRKLYAGAFIATMPNGHKGVFYRASNATHRGARRQVKTGKNIGHHYRPALKIKEQFIYFSQRNAIDVAEKAVDRVAKRDFGRLFAHEANRRLAKIK